MSKTLLFFALLGLTLGNSCNPPASNSSTSYPHIPSGNCIEYTITVPVTSENLLWAAPPFTSNYDVTNWLFNSSRKDSQNAWKPFAGSENVTKDYMISATFCTPKQTKDSKETTVLLATSGLGYDGRYWAPSYRVEEYSFVEHALKAGYSVFWYDRIGTGKSQKYVLLIYLFPNLPYPSYALRMLLTMAQRVRLCCPTFTSHSSPHAPRVLHQDWKIYRLDQTLETRFGRPFLRLLLLERSHCFTA